MPDYQLIPKDSLSGKRDIFDLAPLLQEGNNISNYITREPFSFDTDFA